MPAIRRQPTLSGAGWSRFYSIVRRIPRGRVATYGQIARIAGLPGQARQVGFAMAALPDRTPVPWHRVVNARGQCSLRKDGVGHFVQRARLEREKVRFDARARIPLELFRWRPGSRAAASSPESPRAR